MILRNKHSLTFSWGQCHFEKHNLHPLMTYLKWRIQWSRVKGHIHDHERKVYK